MKKVILIILAVLLAMPVFSATLSVSRKKPAELDLSPAKTIGVLPIELVPNRYTLDQEKVGNEFVAGLLRYANEDGKYKVVDSASAEIILKIVFESYSVTDDGITLTQKVDGKDTVIKDEWTRTVSSTIRFYVIRGADKAVLGSKEYKVFDSSNVMAKDSLPDSPSVADRCLQGFIVNAGLYVFDTKYSEPISIMDTKIKENKTSMKEALKTAKKKDYKGALEIYKELYEKTNDPAAGFNYARMLQVTNSFDKAETLLKNLQKSNPKDRKIKQALESLSEDKTNYEIINSRKTK